MGGSESSGFSFVKAIITIVIISVVAAIIFKLFLPAEQIEIIQIPDLKETVWGWEKEFKFDDQLTGDIKFIRFFSDEGHEPIDANIVEKQFDNDVKKPYSPVYNNIYHEVTFTDEDAGEDEKELGSHQTSKNGLIIFSVSDKFAENKDIRLAYYKPYLTRDPWSYKSTSKYEGALSKKYKNLFYAHFDGTGIYAIVAYQEEEKRGEHYGHEI